MFSVDPGPTTLLMFVGRSTPRAMPAREKIANWLSLLCSVRTFETILGRIYLYTEVQSIKDQDEQARAVRMSRMQSPYLQ